VAESEAVARGLFFSRATGSPIYFVHLSSPLSVDLVAEARDRGVAATAETCPHFLGLDDSVYARPDAVRFLMTPPIRSKAMQEGLWERIGNGRVQTVGSDHCGYSLAQRGDTSSFTQVSSPGIPGVETSLLILYTFGVRRGHLDLPGLARLMSTNPAKVFGLWPRKGRIEPGADADLVLFDPRPKRVLESSELHTAAGFSPFEGLEVEGRVVRTVCRGRTVYADGVIEADPGWGRFIERSPFDPELAATL
jgi:dihydropyrimidinase